MNWTRTIPTEPGHYWWRENEKSRAEVVFLARSTMGRTEAVRSPTDPRRIMKMILCSLVKHASSLIAICCLCMLLACASDATVTDQSSSTSSESEHVIRAKEYARKELGLPKLEVGWVKRYENYISVWIWELPRKAGGFVVVDVADDGRILGWLPGK